MTDTCWQEWQVTTYLGKDIIHSFTGIRIVLAQDSEQSEDFNLSIQVHVQISLPDVQIHSS